MLNPDQLQAENQQLRRQLDSLLREARANEDKMQRFELLEHRLIAARSLAELVRLLLVEYKLAFDIDAVSLCLVDAEREAARLLELEPADIAQGGIFEGLALLDDAQPLQALFGEQPRPWLGLFQAERHRSGFCGDTAGLKSVALLPLLRHGELIGSLQFGSRDAARYEPSAGTKFLERLAGLIAVCLDSALNQERLKQAGITDALTGVHNRRYFEHRCQIEISEARRYRHPLACMFLDIDHFKRINDQYGHAAGDAVLRRVGQLIRSQMRAGDTIARYGGEEFVLLLPRCPLGHARDIAERIRGAISERPLAASSSQQVAVTASLGLAMLAPQAASSAADASGSALAAQLVAQADRALYQAKEAGRNRVVMAD
ncbi:DUF484 family protein [Paucibacter sp. APW11]|uniref:diguanylate cyclase n=1 Tax=Roseateles aquae TaxID=3077235 RepID=A0ABU3PG13_9BURK|nr:DUF484 family protein [Paucibacter sp. APW11]MDT9001478.1 DUF484 family protein [Paucibacter sp. APW11]